MINFNGINYGDKGITRKSCTRAQYNALTPQDNIIYEVTEIDTSKTLYLGSEELKVQFDDFTLPPNEVTLIAKKYRSGVVGIKWNDPDNVTVDNTTITWAKTVVVRKTGSYPIAHDDGTVVVTETTKNTYASDYFFDSGLTDGTRYYYGIFTQSTAGVWSAGILFNILVQGIQPEQVSNVVTTPGSKSFTVSWDAPSSTIVETDEHFGSTVANYIVVYKTNGFPSTPTDGTAITTSNTSLTVTGLSTVKYNVSIFAISADGGYSIPVHTTVIPTSYSIMTVRIDETNSDPETALVYMDDAESMIAGDDSWDEWFGCYPVVLADGGVEYKKLNKNNYNYFEDGTDASSYLAVEGYDVMTAFPILGYKIWRSGDYLYVSMTDNPNAESDDYVYYAHTKGTTKKDKFYLGAYDAYLNSSKLYSWSDKNPTTSISLTNARTYTTARGTGYQLMAFYQWTFLQCLFILKYKNLDSQVALGRGYVDAGSSGILKAQTGLTNAKGFNYGNKTISGGGTDTTNNRVKFLGIEDCWGNIFQWLDGCYSNSSANLTTTLTNSNFSDSGSGYTDCGALEDFNISYVSKVLGTNIGGFAPETASGSTTTYYADYCDAELEGCIYIGGYLNHNDAAGFFCFQTGYAASSSSSSVGCRICYL